MDDKTGLFWLKDDFRIKKNLALIEASKNHQHVVAFYLFHKDKYDDQEAQKWWISKSLEEFKKKLDGYNINLQILLVKTIKAFLINYFLIKIFTILE